MLSDNNLRHLTTIKAPIPVEIKQPQFLYVWYILIRVALRFSNHLNSLEIQLSDSQYITLKTATK